MPYPSITVDASLTTVRFTTPSYTSFPTSDVRALDIEHGRHSELDGSDPGTLAVDLFSDTRTYDPNNTAGAYYPNLKPGRKVRVTATYDSTSGGTVVTFVAAGSAVVNNSGGLVGPGLPAGVQAANPATGQLADLMVCMASIRNSGTGTVDTPSGWTPLVTFGNVSLFGRYYQTGDTVPLIFFTGGVTNATTQARIVAFRGCDQDITTVVHAVQTVLNGSAQDIAYPALTVSTPGCAVVACGWKQDDWTSVATLSGFIEAFDSPTTTGDDSGQVLDYQIQTSAAGTNISSGSFTVTGGASAISRGIVVALKPYRGTRYEIFNGWTTGWPNKYGLRTGLATLKATGPFGFLQRATVPDAYSEAVLADSPTGYYRLGDSANVPHTLVDSSGNGRHGRWSPANGKIDSATSLVHSAEAAVKLAGSETQQIGLIPATVIPSLRGFSVEFWVDIDKVPDPLNEVLYGFENAYAFIVGNSPGGGPRIAIYGNTGTSYPGALSFKVTDTIDPATWHSLETGTYFTFGSGTSWALVAGGGRLHVVCTVNSAGTSVHIWLNGYDFTGTVTASGTLSAVPTPQLVPINWGAGWDGDAVLDELAFYGTELNSTQVATHFEAGYFPGDGDTTGARIGRILDLVGWPADLRDLDTGQTSLGIASDMAGKKALDYGDIVTATEQGVLTEGHDDAGKVRFQDRAAKLTDTRSSTVQTWFSDQAADLASTAVVYSGIDLATDDRPAANIVTVKWVGGEVTATDSTSVDAYGEIPATVETRLESYDEATSLCDWILTEQSALFTRVRSIELHPNAMTGTPADRAWMAALSRKVGDRVRVVHQPASTGAVIDQHLYVIGVEHHASGGVEEWVTRLHLAPAITTTYWILGTAQLGTDTRLSY